MKIYNLAIVAIALMAQSLLLNGMWSGRYAGMYGETAAQAAARRAQAAYRRWTGTATGEAAETTAPRFDWLHGERTAQDVIAKQQEQRAARQQAAKGTWLEWLYGTPKQPAALVETQHSRYVETQVAPSNIDNIRERARVEWGTQFQEQKAKRRRPRKLVETPVAPVQEAQPASAIEPTMSASTAEEVYAGRRWTPGSGYATPQEVLTRQQKLQAARKEAAQESWLGRLWYGTSKPAPTIESVRPANPGYNPNYDLFGPSNMQRLRAYLYFNRPSNK